MSERVQEKMGWIGGWSGGFIWVVILSAVLMFRGQLVHALAGLLIAGMAGLAIFFTAPWRHPRTTYRKLMVPIYLLLFVAVGWGIVTFGGPESFGFTSWWSLAILFPALLPLWTVGNRCWDDRTSN
ncbi:MAG: hypothetical protein GTN98_11230 [Woeseiaceae bacterium]|nr:hypothetical protein [Woeseiaceae bacterium]